MKYKTVRRSFHGSTVLQKIGVVGSGISISMLSGNHIYIHYINNDWFMNMYAYTMNEIAFATGILITTYGICHKFKPKETQKVFKLQ